MIGDRWAEEEAREEERREADLETAELHRRGREAARAWREMRRLRDAGRLVAAAQACPHGWGYPLDSIAAGNVSDPRKGQPGFRCLHCGSVLHGEPWDSDRHIMHPCDWLPKLDN